MLPERLTPLQTAHLDQMRRALARSLMLDADREEMRGGMRFQAIKGRDYLVRYHYDAEGKKVFRSLGARSPGTERTLQEFMDRREAWKADRAASDFHLDDLGRFAKAHRLARMPVMMADAIDALRKAGLFSSEDGGQEIAIAGTAALHAYECDIGMHLPASVLRDRPGLDLVVAAPPDHDLLVKAEASVADALDEARLVMDDDDAERDDVDGFPLRVIVIEIDALEVPLTSRGNHFTGAENVMMAVARDGRAVGFPVVHPAIWLALATRGLDEFDFDPKLQARLDFVSGGYGVTAVRLSEITARDDEEEGDMRLMP
jgi:hypothetical protein